MNRENGTTAPIGDAPTGGDIFVPVEMSRSKWVVGIHTPLADKIALHAMACGDVDALLALIDRARSRLGRELANRASSFATRRVTKASGSIGASPRLGSAPL